MAIEILLPYLPPLYLKQSAFPADDTARQMVVHSTFLESGLLLVISDGKRIFAIDTIHPLSYLNFTTT